MHKITYREKISARCESAFGSPLVWFAVYQDGTYVNYYHAHGNSAAEAINRALNLPG